MAQLSFRRMWYVGCRSPINVWPVMRHQAGMSACAPRSRAVRRRICPGRIASRRRRSSSTRSPQPRSPASQWASAGRGAGVLVLMGRRALRWRSLSHAQVARLDLLVAEQLLRPGLVHDPALAHEIDVIGDAEREGQILLDDEDRRTTGLELPDDASELSDQERRQPLGRLVHQEDVGIADQRAPAGQHLLLAARELVATIAQTLTQPGKEVERPREAPARAVAGPLADRQMLADRERREDAAALRHQAHPAARDLVGRQTRDVLAAQQDAAAARRREADDRAHERGLADAVAA